MSADCLFCKISNGEIPASLVYEDDRVVVFNDIDPKAPHHLLIVPRKHIETTLNLEEVDASLIGHIYLVAGKVSRQLGFAEEGFRIVNNCNDAGGQTVWHIHFHLLGGRDMSWPPG